MSKQHSKYSPSSAYRWAACSGSVQLIEECKNRLGIEDEPSEYALEGSRAHEIAAAVMQWDFSICDDELPKESLKAVLETADPEMIKHAYAYCDYVRKVFEGRTQELIDIYVEYPVTMTSVGDGVFGTVDLIAVDRLNEVLHIFDYKYGRGLKVSPMNNLQLILYAIGALDSLYAMDTIKQIDVHIFQPRINSEGAVWKMTPTMVDMYRNIFKQAVLKTQYPSQNLTPGDEQCRWCPAKPVCPALREVYRRVWYWAGHGGQFFKKLEAGDVEKVAIGKKQVVSIISNRKLMEGFIDSVQKYATDQILQGEEFPKLKLVNGRSVTRLTGDADNVLREAVGDVAFTSKIKPIGELRKVVPPELFERVTYKPQPSPVVVMVDDPRHEIAPVSVDDFEDLTK